MSDKFKQLLIVSTDASLKELATANRRADDDDEEDEDAPVNAADDDDDKADNDNNNSNEQRRRGKPKTSWKRTFFKQTENRLECLLTPESAPSKGGTHLHEKYLSVNGEVSSVLHSLAIFLFVIFVLFQHLCVVELVNATSCRFEWQFRQSDRISREGYGSLQAVGG